MTNGISEGKKQLLKIVFAAILAALALVVGYIEIVWPIAPWLKLDFSEVIILISFILIGFKHTLGVIVIRSIVRWLVTSHSTNIPFPFFGELVAITASIVVVLVYMFIRRSLAIKDYPAIQNNERVKSPYEQKKSSAGNKVFKEIMSIILVAILMTLFMVGINFFIVTPAYLSKGSHYFYSTFLNSGDYDGDFMTYLSLIVVTYAPFNAVKFASCMVLFSIIKKPITSAIDLR